MNYETMTVEEQCRLCLERDGWKIIVCADGCLRIYCPPGSSLGHQAPDLTDRGACIALLERWCEQRIGQRTYDIHRYHAGHEYRVDLFAGGDDHGGGVSIPTAPDLATACRLAFLRATEPA